MFDQFLVEALISNGIPVPNMDFRGNEFLRWGKNHRYWAKKIDGGATTASGYVFGDFATDLSKCIFEKRQPELRRNDISKRRHVYVPHDFNAKANEIYNNSVKLEQHPYIDRKQIRKIPFGLKYLNGKIVVPIYDCESLISLQFIDSFGNKKYLEGSRKNGGYFTIGNADNHEIILITEGLATGCSVFEATGFTTFVAFDAGNLSPVAGKIRSKYSDAKIIICADNDAYGEKNIGVIKATEAAEYGCSIAIPEFVDKKTKPTDFNDLMILEGKERAKEIILNTDPNSLNGNDIPAGFELTDEGLYHIEKWQKRRISNYIKVIATAIDENDFWGIVIEIKNIQGEKKQIFIHDYKFSGNCEILRRELANLGLKLDGSQRTRDLLNKYLTTSDPQKHVVCISKNGWHFNKIFAMSDKVIGKLDTEVICGGSDLSIYKRKNSIENWKENVAKYCQNNSRLILPVCSAFAAPVLDICGFANGGFHFTGRSSIGKTTCLKVAASVYGDKNYIKNWRATDNGLESIAAKHNDSLLILDEISQVDPNKVGDIAYMLANGCGKTRANSFGGATQTKTWKILFLSSGETSLSTHMNSVGKKSQTGQDIRLLNINASPSNQSFGIFEDLHGFENGADLANHLIEKSSKYYGTVIIKFIENLVKNRDYIAEYISEKMREFKKIYLPQNASGQDIRVFERFAFVGAVGEYATEKGLTGWNAGNAIDGCMKCFRDWLDEKGGFGNIEEIKILEQVKLFLEQYAESRLLTIPAGIHKVTSMVGYRDDDFYYITPESFKNVICKGFELKFAISVLKNKGWLITGTDGKSSIVKTINHVNMRVYKLCRKSIMS